MEKLRFENLNFNNVDFVHEIEEEIFPSPWSMESFIGEINNESAHYVVMLFEDTVIGYGGMWKVLDEGHITNIAVSKTFQGKGFGNDLVEAMLILAKELDINDVTLEVRESNTKAIKLYEKFGFKLAGVRKKYYSDNNEDAYIMWVSI